MFSVLLSIYAKEQSSHLKQCLDSLLNQTVLPTEIILVKDGPLAGDLDGVLSDYAIQYPILKIVPLPYNQGLGKALNEGLKHCSCELVARMDTDDISKPDRFEKQITLMQKHPDVAISSAWIDEFEGEPTHVVSVRKIPEKHEEIIKYARSRCPINHPVVMFRKQAVLDVGGYQHCPCFEDYYLWVRMLMNGKIFYNQQESLLYFRASSDMFKRRGGWKYFRLELHFQYLIYKLGFISLWEYVRNFMIRLCIRIMPNSLRSLVYKRFLRK